MAGDLAEQISQKTSGLIQSSNHRALLDVVDSLRSHGVSHYVDLPQIIVCGSQSSGKSSTLESLSGIAFPTAEGLCTRFVPELILRRGTKPEIRSPTAPNFTLVDLPGLFGASDKNQSDDDAALPVTKFARDIDPMGVRTLGLITKPDKIERGSDSEKYYVELAQNQNVKLNLGWHVLRNKGHTIMDDTAEERDAREAAFFEDSVWNTLDPSQLGVNTLRTRLRKILWKQIQQGLPGVKSDVQSGITDCNQKLTQLGKARSTRKEKHTYLQRISSRLSVLVRAAIDGVYSDLFFESHPGQQDAFERRLRANVQKILADYAEKMRVDGHALEIVEDYGDPICTNRFKYAMRKEYLKEVKILMVECRGRELPGTFNPLVVGDLFSRQCKPWEFITQNLVERIHEAALNTFSKVVSELCDQNTKSRYMKGLVRPSLHCLRQDLKDKVDEFLKPHLTVHPITYNDWLVRIVQEVQEERHNRNFDLLSRQLCAATVETAPESEPVNLKHLLEGLRAGTKPDVEEYSSSLAVDVAAAYYEVALKKFIDDVSVNAIETCLIQRLPDVFSPDVVWDLSDEQVEQLGSEDDGTVKEREDLVKKLRTLEKGLMDLDAFTARSGAQDIF
ncbi:hypothetical protein DL765_004971 [Monosporascus sp. GIB2]|nr:hypothetical protein DL765_004971 [Monosporascus sp. GIB2]